MLCLTVPLPASAPCLSAWQEDLQGMVNGAVETCGASFHRFDKYLNFSNPLIVENFDPQVGGGDGEQGEEVGWVLQWKHSDALDERCTESQLTCWR